MGRQTIRRLATETDMGLIYRVAKQVQMNHLFVSLPDKVMADLLPYIEEVTYQVGDVIVQQGEVDKKVCYYILISGECHVYKDGKQLPGKYGSLIEGSSFGEIAVLTNKNTQRRATIVASKGPEDSPRRVILLRLDGAIFRDSIDKEKLEDLLIRIGDVIKVVDALSGIDTKIAGKGTIIRPYKPSGWWLTKQYRGTILQHMWTHTLAMMLLTAIFAVTVDHLGGGNDEFDYDDPNENEKLMFFYQLPFVAGSWGLLTTLVTFVTTFFLADAFKFWKRFYWTTRGIQGRFNDISLMVASTTARDENGRITAAAHKAMQDIGRLQRLTHQLYWSTVVKRFSALRSREGLSYLYSFSLITYDEYESLVGVAATPGLGVHHAAMAWLTTRVCLAGERGEITADSVSIFDKITNMRMLMARIPDMYNGRMPIAYVHFVHLLTSFHIAMSPFALFPTISYWSILAVGILTLFYRGIFVLSLMFLDPVDNDTANSRFTESAGFDVGVLIREHNASSVRYEGCVSALPVNYTMKHPDSSNDDQPDSNNNDNQGLSLAHSKRFKQIVSSLSLNLIGDSALANSMTLSENRSMPSLKYAGGDGKIYTLEGESPNEVEENDKQITDNVDSSHGISSGAAVKHNAKIGEHSTNSNTEGCNSNNRNGRSRRASSFGELSIVDRRQLLKNLKIASIRGAFQSGSIDSHKENAHCEDISDSNSIRSRNNALPNI